VAGKLYVKGINCAQHLKA